MRKIFAGLVGVMLSFGALAEEAQLKGVEIEGKKIMIDLIKPQGDNRIMHSKDLQNGIYVAAVEWATVDPGFKGATKIIRERLEAKGFKVVDTVEGASVGIHFWLLGDLKMVDADKSAPADGKGVGLAVASFVGGGVASLGGLFSSNSQSSLCGFAMLKPSDARLKKTTSDDKEPQFNDNLIFKYQLEKENKATSDIVLTMMIDQWINTYLVLDTDSVAASAIAPAESLAAAK